MLISQFRSRFYCRNVLFLCTASLLKDPYQPCVGCLDTISLLPSVQCFSPIEEEKDICVHMCEHVCVPLCECMCVFEQTSALVISKNHVWSQFLEFWGSGVLATIAAKQMCTPNCFVHRCIRGGTEVSKVIWHVRLHARPKILCTMKINYRSVLMAMKNVMNISFKGAWSEVEQWTPKPHQKNQWSGTCCPTTLI